MQTLPGSLGQKRPRSPQTQSGSASERKRRAMSLDKPMLHVDTSVPSRPTPELVFLPTASPYQTKLSAIYTNTVDFSTSLNWSLQNMGPPPATEWMQHAGVMHNTTMPTDKLQYHNEIGFLESCKSSIRSSASFSIFSSVSGLSNFDDALGDLSGILGSDPQSSLPSNTNACMNDSMETVITRLQKLQDVLADQGRMLEEIMRVLRVRHRS
ncbi:hypothetical protein BKA63DRAFT_497669 [Paraphoma chrysanthemicola]|nr:hypothetical protein BKA63DRAFT_497669 [Paraphoma chrysanthemicola]